MTIQVEQNYIMKYITTNNNTGKELFVFIYVLYEQKC